MKREPTVAEWETAYWGSVEESQALTEDYETALENAKVEKLPDEDNDSYFIVTLPCGCIKEFCGGVRVEYEPCSKNCIMDKEDWSMGDIAC